MCIQGTWADALIIQAVADALNVTIQIVESKALHHLLLFTQFRKEILPLQLMNATMYQPLRYNQMPPFQCAMN